MESSISFALGLEDLIKKTSNPNPRPRVLLFTLSFCIFSAKGPQEPPRDAQATRRSTLFSETYGKSNGSSQATPTFFRNLCAAVWLRNLLGAPSFQGRLERAQGPTRCSVDSHLFLKGACPCYTWPVLGASEGRNLLWSKAISRN